MFDAVVLAGGGNRCYWQGGFYEAIAGRLDLKPRLVIGASAGAFAACYSLLGNGPEVRALVIGSCGRHLRNFDIPAWRSGKPLCPVGPMYRDLLDEVIDQQALVRLKEVTDLQLAIARLPRRLPPIVGAVLGISAYQVEKKLFHPVHPVFGRRLGYRSEFVSVNAIDEARDLCDALIASGCVPPFMPTTLVGGLPAFDGGLVDNVPVEPLAEIEAKGGRSLVLLTRIYKRLPALGNRIYVQPSEKVPVGQFDITNPEGIRKAYELGLRDGSAFARSLSR